MNIALEIIERDLAKVQVRGVCHPIPAREQRQVAVVVVSKNYVFPQLNWRITVRAAHRVRIKSSHLINPDSGLSKNSSNLSHDRSTTAVPDEVNWAFDQRP